MSDKPVMKRQAFSLGTKRGYLNLHPRHIDTRWAFAFTSFARYTKLHRVCHIVTG